MAATLSLIRVVKSVVLDEVPSVISLEAGVISPRRSLLTLNHMLA